MKDYNHYGIDGFDRGLGLVIGFKRSQSILETGFLVFSDHIVDAAAGNVQPGPYC